MIFCFPEKDRSSPPQVFLSKDVLKISCKFTGEHPYQSATPIKLQSNFNETALWHMYSPVHLLHISRIPFPKNISGGLLLKRTILLTILILTSSRSVQKQPLQFCQKETPTLVFFYEYCKTFKNTFFLQNTSRGCVWLF